MAIMTIKRPKYAAGMTLVEVMGAILILSVAVIGASAYRYHSALDARKADRKTIATRVALLLCESWRGVEGDETFDPNSYFGSDLAVEPVTTHDGPGVPTGFGLLGVYKIVVDGLDCRATLSWKEWDITAGLRVLNVIVVWDWDPYRHPLGAYKYATQSYRLTTYTTY